ncbi:MAG: MmgE/PrpD family protein [Syntrophales bacterium LBB04]|nr:MmgE/PrpD family protein [Syntrophales bacterium LBB04]
MELEKKLVDYVVTTRFEDIPKNPIRMMKDVMLNAIGAILSGAAVPGCPEAVKQCKEWGGKRESTILVHGGQVPAHNAAFANSFMARAVAVDEAILPGVHIGGSSVPTALAVAEMVGGCSGKDLLTAMTVGTELSARLNASTEYNGFDSTGVCTIFASAAIAGRILGLDSEQMWNTLGHAFNRAGGSWQGTIDGSIAARVLQGCASQGGIISAQLAKKGITGPKNFLEGVYGYFHLFAEDKYDGEAVAGELGKRFNLMKTFMKKYPSCGTTNPSQDAIFDLMTEKGITPDELAEIKVTVTPSTYNLTGKPFEYGDNLRISAMYSIQYCVASALLRGACKLSDFDEPAIREPRILEIIKQIHVTPNPELDKRNQLATDIEVRMKNGAVYHKSVDFARGMPDSPLTREEFMEKFEDCVSYAKKPLPKGNIKRLVSLVEELEKVRDVRRLIPLLVSQR